MSNSDRGQPKRLPLIKPPPLAKLAQVVGTGTGSSSNELKDNPSTQITNIIQNPKSISSQITASESSTRLAGKERVFYSDFIRPSSQPKDAADLKESKPSNSDTTNDESSGVQVVTIGSPNLRDLIKRRKLPNISSVKQNIGSEPNTKEMVTDNDKIITGSTVTATAIPATEYISTVNEPKVIISHESRMGLTPRKLAIERKKRIFSEQNIQQLLSKHGITERDYDMIEPSSNGTGLPLVEVQQSRAKSFLPLHLFDNKDWDERPAIEWLSYNPHAQFHHHSSMVTIAKIPVPAFALVPIQNQMTWESVLVTAYDFTKELWKIVPDPSSSKSFNGKSSTSSNITPWTELWLHKINLMFKSEDPFKFAQRVAEAHHHRRQVEDNIRFQFYVDGMPTTGGLELPESTAKKIIQQAVVKASQKGKGFMQSAWVQNAIRDIRNNYARTMNYISLEFTIHDPVIKSEFEFLSKPLKDSVVEKTWDLGTMPTYDFAEQARKFKFGTFWTNPDVFKTWSKVRIDAEKAGTSQIFNTNITKTLKLDEFEQLETAAINASKLYLRETWLPNLKNMIKNGLRDVGKGWFNLEEKSMEVYRISKLQKFMTGSKLVMEDGLRFMVMHSLNEFIKLLQNCSPDRVEVNGTNAVKASSGEDGSGLNTKKPLFMLDLVCRDGKLSYNIDLNAYKNVLFSLVDKALASLEGLPQLEPLIMNQLFWSSKGNLDAMRENDPFVASIKAKISAIMDEALVPLEKYLRQYDKHLKLINLDPMRYMQDYEAENHTNEEMEMDILRHIQESETLNREIPTYIHVGMFWVNCDSIKGILRKDLSKVVLDLYARRTSKVAVGISGIFNSVQQKLRERPSKIEELVELREYMKTVPEIMEVQKSRISDMLIDFEKLEKFRYELANEDFKSKWLAFSWPAKIEELMESTRLQLDLDEATFLKGFTSDQEIFKERLNQLSNNVSDFAKHHDIERINEIVAEVARVVIEIKECTNAAHLINSREKLFGQNITVYEEVGSLAKDFEPYKAFWTTTADWLKWRQAWLYGPFLALQAEDVDKNLSNAWRVILKAVKNFKQIPQVLAVANKIKDEMDDFKPKLPLIQALRNPGMRDRHWDRLSTELGMSLHPDDTCTLTQLIDMNLMEKIEPITKICDVAGKEYSIESSLDKMESDWKDMQLEILSYRETGTFIMKVNDEALRLLDDHIVMTQSMSFSPFRKPFQDRISLWESKLRTVQEVLEEWMTCQRSWMYLEPIFSSEDIAKQLPNESKRFVAMDRSWRKIMSTAKTRPGLIDFCSDAKLLEQFHECNKLLEQVSKGLSAYLESKRLAFPRFFFLSDDELLQILSQTKDPTAVQPHLRKCFENIMKLEFQPKDNLITAMFSADGERVPMCKPFYPIGNVEDWLRVVEDTMKASVKQVVKDALDEYSTMSREQWVLRWPGQAILTASQTHWTSQVTEALEQGIEGVRLFYSKQLQQLEGLVRLVRGELPPVSRLILGDLIVIDVHARDIVKRLLDNNITSPNDFEWMSQLRYYWEESSHDETAPSSPEVNAGPAFAAAGLASSVAPQDVRVKIVNANFKYGYEYLGNTGRLVITPLTDRCYLTLTGAIHLTMGGSPAGPAGTGKTETVKDLAKSLAKQCVVFNCSDQLDYLAMAKFFKGLASAGAWICFDEFNRIDIEVLSVISQQITTIQRAIVAKMSKFMFEGVELGLDPTCAIMITMNPGYAGRTELPDNLKALFRPVAMMIPDYAMIAEISLFSFGFSNAKTLSQKMVATFKLSSEQLSSQDHYDFGMRAVKTVISSAGNLKRNSPDQPEEIILLRALCDCNLPKFLADDVPLFNGIISDLFPGIQIPSIDYGSLLESIFKTCQDMGLQPVDSFLRKCIQLYETTVVRHGLMLVGPTGGGKTCCYRVLSKALTNLKLAKKDQKGPYEVVKTWVLNPKSITMGQLYGEFDPQTHEWTDGILSSLVREGAEDAGPDKKWYVFDGPVDAVWIESMNTVLDDNKKLCLSSGEIIKLTPSQKMIFEVENLAYASPATVSRCGMVYLEPSALGIQPLLLSWLESVKKNKSYINEEKTETTVQSSILGVSDFDHRITSLFDTIVPVTIEFMRKQGPIEKVPTMNSNLVSSLFRLFDSIVVSAKSVAGAGSNLADDAGTAEDTVKNIKWSSVIEPSFYFCVIWSIGASFGLEGREKFDKFIRGLMHKNGLSIALPSSGLVYDYRFDLVKGTWVHFLDSGDGNTDAPVKIDPRLSFAEIIVPTIDSVRNTYLLDLLLSNNVHVLCLGTTGTAKTVTISEKLIKGMPADRYTPIFINFSARTSANQTQDLLDGKMDKRRKGVFGPPLGKRFIIFIDDLNMPAVEIYGAQPPIELIRQWMDHDGWYDRKAVGKFMEIVDVSFVTAMCPPGGGRNKITPRITRHFNLINFVEMQNDSLKRIFGTILDSFFEKTGLISQGGGEIASLTEMLVDASIHVYDTIRDELLPTPAKSHYTFNLRDLSKVFQGILSIDVKSLSNQSLVNDVLRLWVHESSRVFQDRLADDQDRSWFTQLLKSTLSEKLGCDWETIITPDCSTLIYGDFMIPGAEVKSYSQVKDVKKLVKVVEDYLEDFNNTRTNPMKLVMFLDAIEHVSRICRIIRQPMGNALLLGVGGSGRQSLSRLAAHMEEFDYHQIEVSKNYGLTEWKEDLKKVLLTAGIEAKPMVFIFTDNQIVQESFLEDINNILNAGDVPNIYTGEEMDRILTGMRPVSLELGLGSSKEALFALYISRVKQNLHLILCMSPIGEVFRNRLRMFPSLVNCCTIDWFNEWPEEALRSVAASFLSEMNDLGPEKIMDGVISICVSLHQTVRDKCKQYRIEMSRYNYVTPKSYLELLSLYKSLHDKKRGELVALRKRTSTGLDKLLSTTKEVEILQEELGSMQPMLIQTSQDIEVAMKQIAQDKSRAEEMRESISKEEAEASKKAEETKFIADEAKRDLDEALPALDAALASLKNLTKGDIIEVRSMQRPPDGVKLVIEAVCIMKGVKPKKVDAAGPTGKKVDDYWDSGRALLADPAKFLESLTNFDKDNIPEQIIIKIKPYIDSPDFQVEQISRVSKAATCLCQWVRAMEKYFWVSKSVAPKRARLQEAQDSLEQTIKALNELKRKMRETEMSIREMEKKFTESLAKKEELARKVTECNLKLGRAEKLLSGLADEKMRWAATIETLDARIKNVVGDVLMAAGSVAYLGAFTTEYRQALIKQWIEKHDKNQVPHSENPTLMESLGESVKIRHWEICGLPKESLSRDNAIIVSNARRWPLLIDPQGQANKWIKNMEKDAGLDVLKLTDRDFLRTLENAVRFGRPCLLENIQESLDPALEPILQKQIFKQGGSNVIKIGESIIPYHDDFRFYMTTKLPNPHYSPEIAAKVTLLNFTLSPSGLEDQLLALVVANERPDLEEAKNALVVSNAKMKKELKEIEDKILYLLSSVQGSPVDDERLIETLAASKVTSSEIQVKVASAEQTEKAIDATRIQYAPVAVRTRILFFCITELGLIDPMYQYSLGWFMTLFTAAIGNSEKSDDLPTRLKNLNEYFTFSLFTNVCRSLFEKHKLLFSFLLTIRILMNDGKIDGQEWRFLLAGGDTIENSIQNPCPDWLTQRSWLEIQSLSQGIPSFKGLADSIIESNFVREGLKAIFESPNPHREELPSPWKEKLDLFQKLLLLRCLRSDRVTSAIQDFVAANLGDRFIEPQTSELAAVYKESYPWTPLIFVLSPGADPANSLLKFADEMRFGKKMNSISLGQGQGPRAELLLREGMERGLWILLQNCHLSPSWMPTLDKIVEGITPDKVHRDFRLWLTSMPTAKFPVSILQNGVKMTVEPPKGVKANLMRTYATFNEDFIGGCSKTVPFKKLLLALCLFHAVIQERRKFGPLGWNIPYEFTDGDMRICIRQLKMFLEEYDEIPFKVLKYTVGEINYGGRVTDDWDRRLIMNILEDYYTPKALEDGYRFSQASEVFVSIPAESYQSYKNYIKGLPLEEGTDIFGMLDNANITFAQKETFTLFENLLVLMPKSSSGSGSGSSAKVKSRDEVLMDMAKSIASRVPEPFDLDAVAKKYPVQYKESMSTVLIQEVVRFNRLLAIIHDSLKDMIKALKGLVVLSESLELMCNSMFINQVPKLWAEKAYPSLKGLASWISDLVARCSFLQKWIDNGIPSVFWISGFFFPQAFLTGTLQNYARKHVVSIDLLSFEFEVLSSSISVSQITSRPEDGCYIYGLFLEGARWDGARGVLGESRPKELYTDMPIMWLKPTPNRKKPDHGIYDCPVYKTLTRAGTLSTTGHSTNYVLTIEVPSDMPQSHWIKRGVALICGLDY